VRARAKGESWQELAEGQIAQVVTLIEENRLRRAAAESQLTARQAVADAAAIHASLLLGKVSDDIWNAVGRPRNDSALSVMFPGGIAYYTDTTVDDQPHRMDLLISLLESRVHPKLDPAVAKVQADMVRQEAATLRAAQEPARAARAEVRLSSRIATSLSQSGQMALANLKRRYKAAGFSEPEIHTVIPDRPRAPAPVIATPPPTPPPAPGPTPVPSLPAVPGQPLLTAQ
jgi:hypothetical protein